MELGGWSLKLLEQLLSKMDAQEGRDTGGERDGSPKNDCGVGQAVADD